MVRRLFDRTRPFRYAGFWTLAAAAAVLPLSAAADQSRTATQLAAAVAFCLLWPWLADLWHRHAAGRPGAALDVATLLGECAIVGAVFAWASVPLLITFAAAVCLLAGGNALMGWRLLFAEAFLLVAGSLAGAAAAPVLTIGSAPLTDALALTLVFGFSLALAHLSFRQARRLAAQRQRLADESAALERINRRMERYLPPSLRDRVVRAPEEPCRWERRWLTVAFVDLVGFTELSDRLEAEPLAAILDEYLGALIPAAERCGGEVSKLLGDGVLLVFGLRGPEDRHAGVTGAVRFCRDLPALLAGLAGCWRSRGEPVALSMRAGIASGYCTLGDRGGAGRLDFTLIGTPVNLASRLQAHAAVDDVLLDEPSAALAEQDHALAPPRALTLKGLGPTRAFALSAAA